MPHKKKKEPPKKEKVKKSSTIRKKIKTKKTKKPVKAVQGLSKSSFVKGVGEGEGVSVPLGNTLMIEDKGDRKEKVEALDADLSRRAEPIWESFVKPVYTEEALDAELEGTFVVNILIDEKGIVKNIDFDDPIGFGMDDLLYSAIKAMKFKPRFNYLGKAISGWDIINIKLELP